MNDALSPGDLNLPNKDRDNLINIASILTGIDAIIAAKDACGLSSKKAISTLEWGMDMILKGLKVDIQ